jgi:hypothetical protein
MLPLPKVIEGQGGALRGLLGDAEGVQEAGVAASDAE